MRLPRKTKKVLTRVTTQYRWPRPGSRQHRRFRRFCRLAARALE
jgi:hypothetical protein